MSHPSHSLPAFAALHAIQVPRANRVLARVLVALMIVLALALTITPWQQNIPGSGRVVAFSPEERQQNIEAPIDGRIARWYVVEGSDVKKGDPIVDLTDNDPSLIERLTQERDQMRRTEEAAVRRVKTIEDRIRALNMVSDLTTREFGGYHAVLAIHAEGSLEAEKMMIARSYDTTRVLAYARKLAGID